MSVLSEVVTVSLAENAPVTFKLPPILTEPPIPTPPVTTNAPVPEVVDTVELVIDVIPETLKKTKKIMIMIIKI